MATAGISVMAAERGHQFDQGHSLPITISRAGKKQTPDWGIESRGTFVYYWLEFWPWARWFILGFGEAPFKNRCKDTTYTNQQISLGIYLQWRMKWVPWMFRTDPQLLLPFWAQTTHPSLGPSSLTPPVSHTLVPAPWGLSLTFKKLIALKYNSYTIQLTCLKCTIQCFFGIFTGLCNHHSLILEYFHTLKRNSIPISCHFLLIQAPPPTNPFPSALVNG